MNIKRQAAEEAISHLGLLKPESIGTIERLLDDALDLHARAICTAYRKGGEQISDEEKNNLGIRKNAFMSLAAFAELSETGRKQPLQAHELTVLRATFILFRNRSVKRLDEIYRSIDPRFVQLRYDVMPDACQNCLARDGKLITDAKAAIFPPADCSCITSNYGISVNVDWLGQSNATESKQEVKAPLTSQSRMRSLSGREQLSVWSRILGWFSSRNDK